MTLRSCLCILMMGVSSLTLAQYEGPIPRRPGRRQWAQPPTQVGSSEPRIGSNPRDLDSQAAELSRLAQSTADDIHAARNRGTISKELNEKLRRIEKLAKTLRREMQP